MKVLLMPGSDPVRYKYMKEALIGSKDIRTLIGISGGSSALVKKIVYLFKNFSLLLKCNIVVFSNDMNILLFRLSKCLHKQIIVDMYVSTYDTNVLSRKLYSVDSKEAKAILDKERYIVSKSSKLIFLNKSERDYYLSVIGTDCKNSYILPLFNTDKTAAKLDFWTNNGSTFNICWWGAENNPIHGLNNVSNALDILYSKDIDFRLYIFGSNRKLGETYYNSFFSQKPWRDRVSIDYDLTFKNGRLEKFLRQNCSVAVGPLSDEIKAKTVITNKALDAISMSIPLITIESRGLREYYDDDMLYYCKDGNADTISNQFIHIMNSNRKDIENHVIRAKNQFLKEFDVTRLKESFIDIIKD